jgi:short-subunit dehydrogenase
VSETAHPVALVTGSSAGIGQEIARVLAARGYDLILAARRVRPLEDLASELASSSGVTSHVLPIDLAEPTSPSRLAAEVAAKGIELDVLVNNAGFGDLGPFADADLPKLLAMVQLNVLAVTELTRLILPNMLKRGRGKILNVGSTAGFQPGPLMAVYYATKAYVNSWSEAIANELAGTGITVTVLCPGPTESEFAAVSGMAGTRLLKSRRMMTGRSVAEAGVRGMMRGQPVVIPGLQNKLMVFGERLLPRSWVVKIVRWLNEA